MCGVWRNHRSGSEAFPGEGTLQQDMGALESTGGAEVAGAGVLRARDRGGAVFARASGRGHLEPWMGITKDAGGLNCAQKDMLMS